jgi:hypothetical protein
MKGLTQPKEVPGILNVERFLSNIKIDNTTNCWNWNGGSHKGTGYGYYTQNRRQLRVHRVSYSIFRGDLNLSKVIDHVCKNRLCVNPDHLRELTSAENATINSDSPLAVNLRRTHCKYNHHLIGDNLIINKKTGKRNCRICQRAHQHVFKRNLPLSDLPTFFNYERKTTYCVNGHDVTNAPKRSNGIGFYCKECASLNRYKRLDKKKKAFRHYDFSMCVKVDKRSYK